MSSTLGTRDHGQAHGRISVVGIYWFSLPAFLLPFFQELFPWRTAPLPLRLGLGISAFLANGVAVGGLSRGPDETSHSAACPGWVQRLGLRSDQSPSLKYSVFPPWVMNCKPPVPRASGGHVLRVWENEALKQSAEISPSAFLSTSANFKF